MIGYEQSKVDIPSDERDSETKYTFYDWFTGLDPHGEQKFILIEY